MTPFYVIIENGDMMDLLLKNKLLSSEVMGDVESIVSIILSSPIASYIDVNTIRKNVATLNVREANNALEPVVYNSSENLINIDTNNIDQFDSKFLLTKSLLSLVSNKDKSSGLTKINGLKAIDEGIRDNIAESLVGNESELSMYDDEKIIVRLLESIYGNEILLDSFFNNKPEMLLDKMNVKHYGPVIDNQLLLDIHDNYYHRFEDNKSLLGEIEMQLIDLFLANENLTEDHLNHFASHLCVASSQFEDKQEMYRSVDQVYPYLYEQLKLKKGKQL